MFWFVYFLKKRIKTTQLQTALGRSCWSEGVVWGAPRLGWVLWLGVCFSPRGHNLDALTAPNVEAGFDVCLGLLGRTGQAVMPWWAGVGAALALQRGRRESGLLGYLWLAGGLGLGTSSGVWGSLLPTGQV